MPCACHEQTVQEEWSEHVEIGVTKIHYTDTSWTAWTHIQDFTVPLYPNHGRTKHDYSMAHTE